VTLEITVGDADLIGRSVREPELFTEIFDRYSSEILRYACARLGGDLAEDVTAETFLAAFRQRSRFDLSAGSARPWLYGIAVRQISRYRRAEARRLRLLRSAASVGRPDEEDFGDRSAERVTAARLGPRLAAVLAGLPRQDRELLLLIAWAGLSYAEAAAAMELTESAIKARLHRIRVRTRRELGGINPLGQEAGNG